MKLMLVFLRGMMMGAADIVPGVSGGTIAFVTGIYERLLGAISGFLPALLATVRHRSAKRFLVESDFLFLLTLLGGILSSVFLFASLISAALVDHPIQIWSFFLGLIVASAFVIAYEVKDWAWQSVVFLLVGAAFAFIITQTKLFTLEHTLMGAFLSGAIAICAMILPGISGSFLLLLIGTYGFVIGAIKSLDISILLVFAFGCGLSLLFTAKMIHALLRHYHSLTLCFLLGLMLGSLDKVWPWKHTLSYRVNSRGESVPLDQVSVLPSSYAEMSGMAPDVMSAGIWFGIGLVSILVVTFVVHMADRK